MYVCCMERRNEDGDGRIGMSFVYRMQEIEKTKSFSCWRDSAYEVAATTDYYVIINKDYIWISGLQKI